MMKRIFTLALISCFAFVLQTSAQIEGYFRLRNVSGVDGQAYMNVQGGTLNPAMTATEAATAASSVFYVKTGKDISSGLLSQPLYQVETITSQDANALKLLEDTRNVLANITEGVFNAVKSLIRNGLESNETVKEQVDAISERYEISLDDFTYEQYREWVSNFDTSLYMERNNGISGILSGDQRYHFYINFPDLPAAFKKEKKETTWVGILPVTTTHKSQDDLNAALLIIGPLLKAAILNGIENTPIVSSLVSRDNTPGIFMLIEALDRIQFGKKLYIIEDSSEARLTFARENSSLTSVIDTGTILWAGDKGRWTLETINDDNPFRIAVGNNLVTPENTYLATFYSEFPYALTDDMKAYTVNRSFTSTGNILNRKYYCTLNLIAEKGGVVPAHTPVIIETASTDANRVRPHLSDLSPVDDNRLDGTMEEIDLRLLNRADKRVLTTANNGLAFTTPGLSVSALPQNTAYFDFGALEILSPGTIYLDYQTTGVKELPAGDADTSGEDSGIYNLSGQRIRQAGKGIYIINGKKVVN